MLCRCCEAEFDVKPILHFDNMPMGAQGFLDKEEIEQDKGEKLELYQCPYCGLIQITDEPVSYFRDVIRASAVSDEMRKFRICYFQDFVQKYNLTGKKVIEIGCGCGEFLELMNLTGVRGFGIEHKKESVDICIHKALTVFEGFLDRENKKIKEAPYDAFFIMNFLEHIPNPNVFLKAVFHNLSEDSVGLIEVPNVDMILQNSMFSEFISDHLMYFTKKTLCFLLEKNGFEVIECYPVWHDYCLAAYVRKRDKINMSAIYDSMNTISSSINSYIDEVHGRKQKVAIWGAGHQALAVISLCKLEKKVEFIVDSADFKQGKYTPGTHLKIVPPEELTKHNIDAVIVMAASYSDEVVGILESEYPEINIATLRDYGLELKRKRCNNVNVAEVKS